MAKKAPSFRLELRAVFYKESGVWFSHCLEMDVLGHGKTKTDALKMMAEAVNLQIVTSIENKNPANIFMPADARYFEMFASGKDVAIGELQLGETTKRYDGVEIDDVRAREFSGELAMA